MALVSFGDTYFVWPQRIATSSAATSTSQTLDAAGEYDGLVMRAAEDMVVSHFGFRCNTASGSPTADVRIETVSLTTGLPTGTLWAANTNATTGTLVAATWSLTALTASATIPRGSVFAMKIVYNSGTAFTTTRTATTLVGTPPLSNFPYKSSSTGGSETKALGNSFLCAALGSSSTVFYPLMGCIPILTMTSSTFTNSISERRGVRFKVPMKCRCVGLAFWDNANGGFNYALYDDAGTELSSSSTNQDGDVQAANNASIHYLHFDNPVTLSPGTFYRAAIEPDSATTVTWGIMVLPSASYMSGMPVPPTYHYTTYVPSTWTDTATDTVPMIALLLDQLDDGAGSGSAGASRSRVQLGH